MTKNLNSLEVSVESKERGPGSVYANFLFSLDASFHSLKHLRIFGGFPSKPNQPTIDFAVFRNLKILILNYQSLNAISQRDDCHLPSSLEVIGFDVYLIDERMPALLQFAEELLLKDILSKRLKSIPRLKMITHPLSPVTTEYKRITNTNNSAYSRNKASLTALSVIRSGEVELRGVEPREIGERQKRKRKKERLLFRSSI